MNDSFVVRRRETAGGLQRVVDRFALGQRAAGHSLTQRLAFQKFRDDVPRAFMSPDMEDDQDVRMIERPCGLRLPFKASQALDVLSKAGGQDRDRAIATE